MRISDWSSDVFSSDLLSIPFLTIIEIADIAVEFMISDCCAERWQYRNGWKFLGQRKVQIPDAGAGRSQEQVGPSLRSEEHTSELQSLLRISYAVFCLKKKIHKTKEPQKTDYIAH